MGVECPHEDFVAENGEPAIDTAAAGTDVRRQCSLILPDGTAGASVEGKGMIVGTRSVEHAIHDERSGFKFTAGHGLVHPPGHEQGCVRLVNLSERAVAAASIIAGIHQP